MGESKTVAQLTGKIQRAAESTRDLKGPQLSAVAEAMSTTMLAHSSAAGLHPGARIAKKPWRGTYIRKTGDGLGVGYANGAVLVNSDIRPYIIRPKMAGGAKNQYRAIHKTGQVKAPLRALAVVTFLGNLAGVEQVGQGGGYRGRHGLKIPGVGWRAYAQRKAHHGKHFFDKAKRPTQETASKLIRAQQVKAVTQALR